MADGSSAETIPGRAVGTATSLLVPIGGVRTKHGTPSNVWLLVIKEGTAPLPAPPMAEAAMPTVDVAKVGKVASAIVLLVAVTSLVVGLVSGFNMIYPPMGGMIAAFAAVFYFMSRVIEKQWRN
jgi:hypothetical protein